MVIQKRAYICDWCGRTEYYDEVPALNAHITGGDVTLFAEGMNPERGWVTLPSPFGDTCPTCYSEVLSLYERIHAPIKAKELAKNT